MLSFVSKHVCVCRILYNRKFVFSCLQFDITGIIDLLFIQEMTNLSVYPNPFKDVITIQSEVDDLRYKMFDVLGKQIDITVNSKTIHTELLEPGIYFLTIVNENLTETFRLIKN